MLIVPHRHVASWTELHQSEQAAIFYAVERAQCLITAKHGSDGFNVGFNQGAAAGQTVPHFHLHVIPRVEGDMADPRGGVRHVIPAKGNYLKGPQNSPSIAPLASTPHSRALIAGFEDGLIRHLLSHIDEAEAVDIAVSFVMESGIRLLRPHLQELLDKGGRLRFLTGDYMDVTDPNALRRLMDLEGDVSLFVFGAGITGFHPKSWIFHTRDGSGVALVGSSNLSETALRTGVEWNLRTCTRDRTGDWETVLDGFENLVARPEVSLLTHEWIDQYEARRKVVPKRVFSMAEVPEELQLPAPEPHFIQKQALAALEETRRAGYSA